MPEDTTIPDNMKGFEDVYKEAIKNANNVIASYDSFCWGDFIFWGRTINKYYYMSYAKCLQFTRRHDYVTDSNIVVLKNIIKKLENALEIACETENPEFFKQNVENLLSQLKMNGYAKTEFIEALNNTDLYTNATLGMDQERMHRTLESKVDDLEQEKSAKDVEIEQLKAERDALLHQNQPGTHHTQPHAAQGETPANTMGNA